MRSSCATSTLDGLIFDLDGTIVDSEPVYIESDREFLGPWGINLTREEAESFSGIGTRDFLRALEVSFPASPFNRLPLEERARLKDQDFLGRAGCRDLVFPPMRKLISELRRRGLPMAIASGSSPQVITSMLKLTGLAAYFSATVSSSEVPRGKPHPDVFLEAARRLRVEARNCAVFEDSLPGVDAAARAGMVCIALPPPVASESEAYLGADFLVRGGPGSFDPAAIISFLESRGLPG